MTTEKLEEKITKTVAETLKMDESKISPNSKFVDDLGADSLDLVELMMAFESSFDCDISDDEASKIITVSDAIKYIKEKTESQ